MVTKPQRKRIADLLYRNINDGKVHPVTMYAGLATGNVSDTGAITGEISGGNYSRVAISMNTATWSPPDDNAVCRNQIDITFPESSTAWGDISVVFFSDVAVGGTAAYYIPISPVRKVQAFTTVYFKGDPTGKKGNIELSVNN